MSDMIPKPTSDEVKAVITGRGEKTLSEILASARAFREGLGPYLSERRDELEAKRRVGAAEAAAAPRPEPMTEQTVKPSPPPAIEPVRTPEAEHTHVGITEDEWLAELANEWGGGHTAKPEPIPVPVPEPIPVPVPEPIPVPVPEPIPVPVSTPAPQPKRDAVDEIMAGFGLETKRTAESAAKPAPEPVFMPQPSPEPVYVQAPAPEPRRVKTVEYDSSMMLCAAALAGRSRGEQLDIIRSIADEVAEELPARFYEKLNGGIALSDEKKLHPRSQPERPLLVLGEYRYDPRLGRSIMLYGGSIVESCAYLSANGLRSELRRIIRHEFTHHIESLCGERGLEIEDELRIEQYEWENAEKRGGN